MKNGGKHTRDKETERKWQRKQHDCFYFMEFNYKMKKNKPNTQNATSYFQNSWIWFPIEENKMQYFSLDHKSKPTSIGLNICMYVHKNQQLNWIWSQYGFCITSTFEMFM